MKSAPSQVGGVIGGRLMGVMAWLMAAALMLAQNSLSSGVAY